ncbi:MAG: hypothetical protein ACTH29_05010 [Fusobacterium sp.]
MKFNKVQMEALDKIIEKNPRGLNSPMDHMLGMGSLCNYFQIEDETGVCGYFSTNNKNIMLEFYLEDENREDVYEILEKIIRENEIKDVVEHTNDPLHYSMCKKILNNIISFDKININYPTINEIYEILGYFKNIGRSKENPEDYIIERINKNEIILFRYNDIIIGIGEIIGNAEDENKIIKVTVSDDYRKKEVDKFIESSLKKISSKE